MPETDPNAKSEQRLDRRKKSAQPIIAIPAGYVLVPAKTLEDLYDLAAIRKGQREETVSLEEVERLLKLDGRL